jgi:type I restriction-modification system DNA methylase subunit
MALSWNEIKERAVAFSKEWAGTYNEEADAKPFLEAFFNVFGITRKRVALFEHKVKKLNDASGYIDLFWKGVIVVEMKSLGKDLDKAFTQAKDYIHGIKEHEVPKYVLVSDFDRFRLFDTEENKTYEFKLSELVKNVEYFGFIAGYQKHIYKEQDPVNIKAAALMGKLHDRLKEIGYDGHPLEVYLVRLLFCLFAEDTTIFEKQQFQDYIEQRTHEDGHDLAPKLQELFQTLNTPEDKRYKNLDEQLKAFRYVNGKLFEEILPSASFDAKMRQSLLECCYLDWSKISPAIFGSMFQSVMNPTERRNLGAHYTSEKNILKLIKPLFLDDLWKEFEAAKSSRGNLIEFHKKLSNLKFLDPACGCGNFLVITYRELRLLEIEILRAMNKGGTGFLDVREIIWLDVDMMYGIEYEEFPARIAEVAMWLMDHQMNMAISSEFGQYFARLPLKKAATIVHGNALRIDWEGIVSKESLQYIIGNPPFIGHQWRNQEQMADMYAVFKDSTRAGRLDYVAAWYLKAAKYIQQTKIKVAFVSTNSIAQGEQTSILWKDLFNVYHLKIHFAHRTFSWRNEAKGNAAVHVVIIGFGNFDTSNKILYEYDDIRKEPHAIKVKNINGYLAEGKEIFIVSRGKPIHTFPEMFKGSQPTDGGNLILTEDEKKTLINREPLANDWIKPFIGGQELMNGINRYCLWLKHCPPEVLNKMPLVKLRLEEVRKARLLSSTDSVKLYSKYPSLFTQDRQPVTDYLAMPRVSSENRFYIPMAFLSPSIIAHEKLIIIPNATLYLFGILMSNMHMAWTRTVCGRLKSDYSYSPAVYNNFPFPIEPSVKNKEAVEKMAQQVLDIRVNYPTSSLANLYSPLTMPPALTKAHQELDKAVDLAYRPQPFISEAKRMEFLFELYEKYTSDLFTKEKVKKVSKKKLPA